MSNLLFVTNSFYAPGARNTTGGTISNWALISEIARWTDVSVLTLGECDVEAPNCGKRISVLTLGECDVEAPNCGKRIVLTRRRPPNWRGADLIRRWLPYVQDEVESWIKQNKKPDTVMATTSTVCAFGARSLADSQRVSIVQAYENFGLWPPRVNWHTRLSLAKQAIARRFTDSKYLGISDYVLTNSEYMRELIKSRFRVKSDRIYSIPQLCDIYPISGVAWKAGNRIGFVNRNYDKNLAFVIKLAERSPDKQFLVFGNTPEMLRRLPANLRMMGWESERNRMFSLADLWIVPSSWPEPFGRVSMEAQAANRPVLVANIGGLPETVSDQRYLIRGYDCDAWLTRIDQLLSLPPDVVGENAEITRARFSEATYRKAIEHLMSRLPSKSRCSAYPG